MSSSLVDLGPNYLYYLHKIKKECEMRQVPSSSRKVREGFSEEPTVEFPREKRGHTRGIELRGSSVRASKY